MENFRTNCPGNFALQLSSPGPEIIGIQIMYLLTCTKTALRWDTFSWHLVTSVTTQGHVRNSTSFHNRQSSESRKVGVLRCRLFVEVERKVFFSHQVIYPTLPLVNRQLFQLPLKNQLLLWNSLLKQYFRGSRGHGIIITPNSAILRCLHEINKA